MKSFSYFGILLFILLTSCQNRNQVTHNKRKYRKGYYKPNRAKVKHRKSKQEEEYAYKSKTEDKKQIKKTPSKKQSTTKKQHSVEPDEDHEEKKVKKRTIAEDHGEIDGTSTSDNEKTNKRREHLKQESEDDPDDYDLPERHKANWVFWLSLILYIILSAAVVLSFFVIESAVLIISIVLAIALALIVINIWNVATHEKSEKNKFIRGSSIFFVSLLFAFIALVVLILILIINYL